MVQWNRHDARITAKHSGRALEVASGSQDVGAPIVQADWTGDTNQRWPVPQLLLASGSAEIPKQRTAEREAAGAVSRAGGDRSWTRAR